MKRSVGKIPLVGLIRSVSLSYLFNYELYFLYTHDYSEYIAYILWFVFVTVSVLVVSTFSGSQRHQTSRVFQVHRLLVCLHFLIISKMCATDMK